MSLQMAMFANKNEWVPPLELPDITGASKIAIDVETRNRNLKTNAPGWPTGDGEVVGYALAVDGWSCYLPIRHLGGGNLDERIVNRWLKKVFECLPIRSCTTPSMTWAGLNKWGSRSTDGLSIR